MRRMYCGASGDDLGLISLARESDSLARYHIVRVVGRAACVLAGILVPCLIAALVVFGR